MWSALSLPSLERPSAPPEVSKVPIREPHLQSYKNPLCPRARPQPQHVSFQSNTHEVNARPEIRIFGILTS
jgi:hypothetical protein